MATNTTVLDQQLVELTKQTRQVLVMLQQANIENYKNLANIYLWWREVHKLKGYLEAKYAERAIESNNIQGKINFRPLLQLVTNGDIEKRRLNDWHKALNAIHVEFEGDKKAYANKKAVAGIVGFIQRENGITGLTGYYKNKGDDEAELVDDSVDAAQLRYWVKEIDETEFTDTFVMEAKAFCESHTSKVPATFAKLPTTQDGYSLVLVKKDGATCNVFGAVTDDKVINDMLTAVYRKDFSASPLPLRSVLEPLHLLNVPHVVAQNVDLYIENSKVDNAWLDDKKISADKRMTYKAKQKELLLSNVCVDAGVVVRAKPFSKLFDGVIGDLCLNRTLRRSIEVRLLHKAMFNMFSTNSSTTFVKNPVGHLYPFQLQLQNKMHITDEHGVAAAEVIAHTSNYQHPPISWQPFYKGYTPLHWQVDIADEKFVGLWHGGISMEMLRNLANDFWDKWLPEYAKKHKRDENKTIKLNFFKKSMMLAYELGAAGYASNETFDLAHGIGKLELLVRSTDIAFLMRQLADLCVLGEVTMAANQHGLSLSFKTDTHNYTCIVPACDAKGRRDAKLCKRYTPSTTVLEEDWDADDATIHFTGEEEQALRAQGKLA